MSLRLRRGNLSSPPQVAGKSPPCDGKGVDAAVLDMSAAIATVALRDGSLSETDPQLM
jgi:hypothetical protein